MNNNPKELEVSPFGIVMEDEEPAFVHPPKPSASVVEAMKHLHDIINCGNCSGSRQSARLALRALAGDGK